MNYASYLSMTILLRKFMLDIFKKDPPLSYIFTPYKPLANSIPNNENLTDQKIAQENLNEIISKDMLVEKDGKLTK